MTQPIRGKGGQLGFRIGPKRKVGRGGRGSASCRVSLNSVQRRSKKKSLNQSEARATILVFRSAPKNTNLIEDLN